MNETRHTVQMFQTRLHDSGFSLARAAQDEINTTFDIQTWQPTPGIIQNNEEFAGGNHSTASVTYLPFS